MSRYSTTTDARSGIEVVTLHDGDAWASIAPAWGNNCFAFHAPHPILETVPFEQRADRPHGYGIPILAPFPNRIRDAQFTFNDKTYRLDPAQHGFVRDKPWRVLAHGASDSDGAWLRSAFDAAWFPDAILAQWPFPFYLEVVYRLRAGVLTFEMDATNTGDGPMPFALGLHPYFQRPANARLTIPARGRWELVDFLPTGRILDANDAYDLRAGRDLAGFRIDDILTHLLPDSDGIVRCTLTDGDGRGLSVEFDPIVFPHVVAFTPPAPRAAVCIEPYTHATDAFNLYARSQIHDASSLAAGASQHYHVAFRPLTPT